MQLFSVGLLVASALPVIKICIMCCVGVLLARRGILNQAGRQNLSLLVFLVFVPGLTFTKLGSAVSFSNLRLWWPLPLNVFLSLGFGSGLGWLCGRLLKAPKWFRTHITLAVGCGNVGNIPLVLVATMCSDPHMPFHDSLQADCQEIGIAYVAFGMWVAMLFQFSLAYSLLKRPEAPALDGAPSRALTDGGISKEDVALLHTPPSRAASAPARTFAARHSQDWPLPAGAESEQLREVVVRQPDGAAQRSMDSVHGVGGSLGEAHGKHPDSMDVDMQLASSGAIRREDSAARFPHSSYPPASDARLARMQLSAPDTLGGGGILHQQHTLTDPATRGDNGVASLSSSMLSISSSREDDSTDAELEMQPLVATLLPHAVRHMTVQTAGHGELSSSPQRPIPQRSMEAGSTSMRGWASRVQRAGDCWTNSLLASRLYALVQPVLNMPTLSAAAGLVIGCTPWLKALFFGDNAPLAVFTDSADMFGQAMIPSILLVLGAVLCKGPGQGKLPVGLVVGVVVMRLIIIPALGLAAVVGLWRLGLFTAPDKLFLLVMLIVNSTPTAINLQTVATMHSNGEAEMSVLLFWQYLACIFTMPLLISIYLWAVS